ncbi:MAG: MinD/ParA family protein [Pseudomonadota bacterium]
MLETAALGAQTPRSAGQNIIAIASGKGGVGKTWLAISLIHAFAKAGRRALLFDGDFGLANVDVQLGLMPERDIADVIEGKIGLRQATVSYPDGGFDVLSGRSGAGNLAALGRPKLHFLRSELTALSEHYDDVVVDLGAGLSSSVQIFSESFGTTLVVLTDEPTSLVDAYAYIKLRATQHRDADIRIVVNQAKSASDGERTFAVLRRACESFLSLALPLAGIVRRDPHVEASIRTQTPLLTRYPNCDAAQDVEALARRLVERK